MTERNSRRGYPQQHISLLIYHSLWITFAHFWVISIILLPAGCSQDVLPEMTSSETVTPIRLSGDISSESGSTLDILSFENDRLRRLDSYQRIEHFKGDSVHIGSTGGEKIFFFCMGSRMGRYSWADISSYAALKKIRCNLEEETVESPVMTGECRFKAGESGCEVAMKALTCQIVIKSLSCDFSGTPYAGEKLHSVRAYLTNVNASCSLIPTGHSGPERIINPGMLHSEDVRRFKREDTIYAELCNELGSVPVGMPRPFLCYENIGNENVIGSPATRLVIEGSIAGMTYYWPIDINRNAPESERGVRQGCRYCFDILIRRKGSTDPDRPIGLSDNEIKLEILSWKEKEDYQVIF